MAMYDFVLGGVHVIVSGGLHGAVQPFSDEDASIETLSHCSSFSDAMSVAEEGM